MAFIFAGGLTHSLVSWTLPTSGDIDNDIGTILNIYLPL